LASSKTISGDLPPSSSVTFFKVCAASLITALPVPTSPVSETLRMPGMARQQPPGLGEALHHLEHAGGQPASRKISCSFTA
jgi:hypothetical protein